MGMTGIVGSVSVQTTEDGGLSVDHWADRATNTIVSVGRNSHPLVAKQAEAFKDDVRNVVRYYMAQAVESSKSSLIAELVFAGETELAEILRKM
jgi:hypothetical protein